MQKLKKQPYIIVLIVFFFLLLSTRVHLERNNSLDAAAAHCLSPFSFFDSADINHEGGQIKISRELEEKIIYFGELLLANLDNQETFAKYLNNLFMKNKAKDSAIIFQQLFLKFPQVQKGMFIYLGTLTNLHSNSDTRISSSIISLELISSFKLIYALSQDYKTRRSIIDFFKNISALIYMTNTSESLNKLKDNLGNSLLETTIDIVGMFKRDPLTDNLIKEVIVLSLVDSPVSLGVVLKRLNSEFLKDSKIISNSLIILYYPEIREIGCYGLFADYLLNKKDVIKANIGKSMLSLFRQLKAEDDRNKVINFIMKEYKLVAQTVGFFQTYGIACSNNFWEDFFRKKESTLLFMITQFQDTILQNNNKQKVMLDIIDALFDIDRTSNKRILTIDEALKTIINIFMLTANMHFDIDMISERIRGELSAYKKNKIGDGKFLTNFNTIFGELTTQTLLMIILNNTKQISSVVSQEQREIIEKKVRMILEKNEHVVTPLINLLGLYQRMKTRFPGTAPKVEETLMKFFIDETMAGDLKKFHKWLYTEAEWNKAIYHELVEKYNYNPKLWEEGLTETFFTDAKIVDGVKKIVSQINKLKAKPILKESERKKLAALLKQLELLYKGESKVRVEITFDFLQDSSGGVGIRDCFKPGNKYEPIPVVHALETNAVLLRIYNTSNNKLISRVQLVMTPQGLVALSFPTDVDNWLSQAVFEMFADLVQRGWVPAVYLNSDKTAYVGSAGYTYARQNNFLKQQSVISEKIEPWNIVKILDEKNPRHYDFGKNKDAKDSNGVIKQIGVFNTRYTLKDKQQLSNYQPIAVESLLKDIDFALFGDEEKTFFKLFRDKLDDKLIKISKTDQKAAAQYKKNTYPYLKVLKDYFNDTKLEPRDLIAQQAKLKDLLSAEFFQIVMLTLDQLYPDMDKRKKEKIIPMGISINNLLEQLHASINEFVQTKRAKKNWFEQKIKIQQLHKKMLLLKKYYPHIYETFKPITDFLLLQNQLSEQMGIQIKEVIIHIINNYLTPNNSKLDLKDNIRSLVLLRLSA